MKISAEKKEDIFSPFTQTLDSRYALEPLRRGGSNEYP